MKWFIDQSLFSGMFLSSFEYRQDVLKYKEAIISDRVHNCSQLSESSINIVDRLTSLTIHHIYQSDDNK